MRLSIGTPSPHDLRESLARDGFVLIPEFVVGEVLEKYRTAAHSAIRLARNGEWPYIRTVPKQFPPWNPADRHHGIWGIQHLLHPDMPDDLRTTFAESYFDARLLQIIQDLLECSETELTMELYNMLIRPDRDFALRWHRDDISSDVSEEEESRRLREPLLHAQWNLALYDDASLIVVPGSHRRARTDAERNADPTANDMSGQTIVKMDAGDVVFYNNNILHRGMYDSKAQRMTLHGTIGTTGADPARARNVLQHGIGDWAACVNFPNLSPEMRLTAQGMQGRLIEMGAGQDVGFSQAE